jgi:hypothetical protein
MGYPVAMGGGKEAVGVDAGCAMHSLGAGRGADSGGGRDARAQAEIVQGIGRSVVTYQYESRQAHPVYWFTVG